MSATVSQDYHLVEKVYADGDIPLSLYENKITGLKVIIANVECPIVKGDLFFATEAFDDDGLPHTLEHLIFLGSEDYPYKGVLDLMANKCLASGTNAYTDTDHTNYTMSTAGGEGFLKLLPIYLDHLLFPTLSDAAYATEVHHINGDGEDAGVVYCEMQARENSGDSRCLLEMMRSLYPGKCGYKSETGGLLENLRNTTSNIKVRNYHKDFYHSRNMAVVVTGPVQAEEVFTSIKHIEDKIVQKGLNKLVHERPWQTPVAPLEASIRRKIQYSSDTDDEGLVYIGFRGPNVGEQLKDMVALGILLEYLNSTAISPIQRDFVECDEPYCSTVSHNQVENSTSCFYFEFESVGNQYLDAVTDKLLALLRTIQEGKEELDMQRLRTVISRKKVRILSVAETSPHEIIIGPVIGHFLYGNASIKDRAVEIPLLDEFVNYEPEFWRALIHKYMTGPEARFVSIAGQPSPSLMKSMTEAEERRLAAQKEKLKDKLPSIAEDLKRAIEENEKPAPASMLSSIVMPSTDNIKFHSIERVVLDDKSKVPFRIQYDSIKTNFVTIHLLMDTSGMFTKNDRLYLPLLSELILECPIERDGELVPYEKIVAELYSDTISNDAGIGISASTTYACGLISMLFAVQMQVEVEMYERAVKWFHEILYKAVLSSERIKTVATRLVSDISQYKRSGSKVVSSALNSLVYQSNSNQWATNFMRQQKFLKKLLKDLKEDPIGVQKAITRIRDLLTRPYNMLVHIACNKEKIDVEKLHEPWLSILPQEAVESDSNKHIKLDHIVPCWRQVKFLPKDKSAIVPIGSIESNFLCTVVKSISDPEWHHLPAVYVLIQYLTQLEGPLWRQVRGLGLSYGYEINLNPNDGLMYLLIYKSTQLVAAHKKMAEIVTKFASGEEEFEDNLFEAAKSSLIFELIKREKSAASRSMQSLVAHVRNRDINYSRELIKKVIKVEKSSLKSMCYSYLTGLFSDIERRTAICCHPSKVDEIVQGLSTEDYKIVPMSLDKESHWNDLEAGHDDDPYWDPGVYSGNREPFAESWREPYIPPGV